MSGSPHVDVAKIVAFLMYGKPLTDVEHTHLLLCQGCQNVMVDTMLEELKKLREDEGTT